MDADEKKFEYNGRRLSFEVAPTHSTPSGKLYIKESELIDSVAFWKIMEQAEAFSKKYFKK
jgi:hypothetical protein